VKILLLLTVHASIAKCDTNRYSPTSQRPRNKAEWIP
jgi:hypothetical protein